MPHFTVEEPFLQLAATFREALTIRGCEVREADAWRRIDATAFLHDEARLLDSDELREAEAALLEDGIFDAASLEALAPSLDADSEAALRAAVKYGWVLAFAQQSAHGPIALSVDLGSARTTALEHRFLVSEISRRSLDVRSLALCTPGDLEPAMELSEQPVDFQAWLIEHEAIGGPPLAFANMELKWDLLRLVAKHSPQACCGLSRAASLEFFRVVARCDPTLFREVLDAAQACFPLERTNRIHATTEDDVRFFPLVEDCLLESTFLDDFRGRQLLYTAVPVLAEDSRLTAVLDREQDAVSRLIHAAAERHAGAVRQ
jgi:hypothetical protein